MTPAWQAPAAVAVLAAMAAHLGWRLRRARQRRAYQNDGFYAAVRELLVDARLENTGTVGYQRLSGRFGGHSIQVLPVVDTLALRRLPVLWLLVTLQEPLPVRGKLDLMMRPNGPTTFSNFDLLPVTLACPAGFPEHAVLRTEDAARAPPLQVLRPHVGMFADPRYKELLIAPNGVRLVWMLAEAERARYGVLRQAEFGEVALQPQLLRELLARLVAVRDSVLACQGAGA